MASIPIIVKIAESPKDWTDYLKLAADVLGPVLTGFFGFWILRITKKIEHSQWRNQKLVEKRIAAWDDVAPRINDIYCYCMRVGNWKNLSPKDVVTWKREVDKKVHISRPYFSERFYARFMDFMRVCFSTYQGHGVDARLKTPLWEHKTAHNDWHDDWDDCFDETPNNENDFTDKYLALQRQLAAEMNIEYNENDAYNRGIS